MLQLGRIGKSGYLDPEKKVGSKKKLKTKGGKPAFQGAKITGLRDRGVQTPSSPTPDRGGENLMGSLLTWANENDWLLKKGGQLGRRENSGKKPVKGRIKAQMGLMTKQFKKVIKAKNG